MTSEVFMRPGHVLVWLFDDAVIKDQRNPSSCCVHGKCEMATAGRHATQIKL